MQRLMNGVGLPLIAIACLMSLMMICAWRAVSFFENPVSTAREIVDRS